MFVLTLSRSRCFIILRCGGGTMRRFTCLTNAFSEEACMGSLEILAK